MTIDMSQFYEVFFDESDELLAEAERLLMALDIENPDPEDLNAIFRAAHSIKGGAATFGMTDMTEITHVLENLLDKIRKNEMALTMEHVDAFLEAKDIIKMQVDGHRSGGKVDEDVVSEMKAKLQLLSEKGTSPAVAAPVVAKAAPIVAAPAPVAEVMQPAVAIPEGSKKFVIVLPELSEKDVSNLADELSLLGDVTRVNDAENKVSLTLITEEGADDIVAICSFVLDPDDLIITEQTVDQAVAKASTNVDDDDGFGFFEPVAIAPVAAETQDEGFGFFEPLENKAAIADVVPSDSTTEAKPAATQVEASVEKSAAPKREAPKPVASAETTSIRVGIEKVDQLINLVGELVITQAMIEQRIGAVDHVLDERLLNSVNQLTRNTRDLQEAVMSIRMMPMDYVFSRFPRMVRDLATKLGKKIEFVTDGASTELDKGLIERIVDPLTHLVRNSIDHGIEKPDVRLAAGKSEAGRLALSANHQGGNIIIEVSDDGGGLNRERILNKAKSSGLPVTDTMPDAEVWQLIFAPGFSTAEAVTDVSGRGVGMDVVKRNITAMGGSVDIRSAEGFGTTIRIALPLTLAILDGMSISVGSEVYILPLSYVIESLQPESADIKEISGQGSVVKVRDDYVPIIPLHQMFNIEPKYTDPSKGILVVLQVEDRKAALFVDGLVGQQQVVVKNLESNYRKVAGVSGATILGDGSVSLILDVSNLLRSSRQLHADTATH
ncbi:MAG: chemotaxis protein CheA [Methylophilaceae bacterium]|uniref:chemotaxis protein CheA n=1 Tax=Methylovorus sp. MM2 TaxID=1848038 RepID=UPI0007DF75C7|nr:chemotaxis protein CheA [Methylovorus sp. MM2]OAM51295.1 chemotaxis protein CheA [Methylovorus sp. MM2]